jgi:hypothetical protein
LDPIIIYPLDPIHKVAPKRRKAKLFYHRGRAMKEAAVNKLISATPWCPKALFFVDEYNEQVNATMRAVEEYYRRRVMVIALPPMQTLYSVS